MTSSNFSVSWDQYNTSICTGLQQLQQQGEFVDMTLAADGHLVRVHQIVIGLASPYLKGIIRNLSTPHPVIFLHDISHHVLCQILEYIYTGEAIIPVNDFKKFVTAGKALQVKGISDMLVQMPTAYTEDSSTPSEAVTSNTSYESLYRDTVNSIKQEQQETDASMNTTLPPKIVKIADLIPVKAADTRIMDDEISAADEQIDNNYSNDDTTDNTIVSTLEKKSEQIKPTLMFSRSNKGGVQVILNRFLYYLVRTYADGRRRWKCVESKSTKCKAFVITDGSKIVSRCNTHIHPRHDKQIMKKVKVGCVYTAVENVDDNNQPD